MVGATSGRGKWAQNVGCRRHAGATQIVRQLPKQSGLYQAFDCFFKQRATLLSHCRTAEASTVRRKGRTHGLLHGIRTKVHAADRYPHVFDPCLTHRRLRDDLDDPQTLADELRRFAARAGLPPGQLPTRAQLLAAERRDLYAAIMRAGGFEAAAAEAGMRGQRRRRGHWNDIQRVVEELKAHVSQQLQPQEPQAQLEVKPQRSVLPKPADMSGSTQPSSIDAREAAAFAQQPRMPSIEELEACGRRDLAYASNLHGYARVAELCGFSHNARGPLLMKGGRLQMEAVLAALAAGCASLEGIIGYLDRKKGIQASASTVRRRLKQAVGTGAAMATGRNAWALRTIDGGAAGQRR